MTYRSLRGHSVFGDFFCVPFSRAVAAAVPPALSASVFLPWLCVRHARLPYVYWFCIIMQQRNPLMHEYAMTTS